jgi:dTDP-4-dehydrorhamnose 3,5-epimerase-like enzyme
VNIARENYVHGAKGSASDRPSLFQDAHGFFIESYQSTRYREAGITNQFLVDNQSHSARGILRGWHFQAKRLQAQRVTVMRGKVFGFYPLHKQLTLDRWPRETSRVQ